MQNCHLVFAFADFEARRMGLGVGGGGCNIKTEANMCIQDMTDFGWFWIDFNWTELNTSTMGYDYKARKGLFVSNVDALFSADD